MSSIKQTSLTAPSDRSNGKYRSDRGAPSLMGQDAENAVNDLTSTFVVDNYPRRERFFADPDFNNQIYALFSFVPSMGATPDKDGIFGMAKIRGVTSDLPSADERAEFLIRNIDSCHKVFTTYVGKPFPVTTVSRFSADQNKIDIRKKAIEIVGADIRQKRLDNDREMREMKERENKLLNEQEEKGEDPLERYIVLNVKRAQAIWTYVENMKKLKSILRTIQNSEKEYKDMDAEDLTYKARYRQRYVEARKSSGLKVSDDDTFMRYLGMEDIDLLASWKDHEDYL